MQPASAPFILRSLYKDDHIIETQVTRPMTELMTSWFGAHVTNQYDTHIPTVSRSLYTLCSMAKGQTLGDEFCDLLPVTQGRPWAVVGPTRIFFLALLQLLERPAIATIARRLLPDVPSHDVEAVVKKVMLCALCLFERFATLPQTVVSMRHLSLKPSQQLESSDGAPGSYRVVGLLLLVELVVRLWRFVRSRQGQKGSTEADAIADSSSDEDAANSASGRCMLCLGSRKCPTATLCGHIFCWRCLAEWIQASPGEALCPFCRQRLTPQSLVPLFFYVAKEPPRVGTAWEEAR